MDTRSLRHRAHRSPDTATTLAEIEAAIGLVVRGRARTVCLVNEPGLERLAARAAALAREAGVGFQVQRGHHGQPEIIIGPRTADHLPT